MLVILGNDATLEVDDMSVVFAIPCTTGTIDTGLIGQIIMDMGLALVDVTTAVTADDIRTFRIGLSPLFYCGDSVILIFVAGSESKGGKEHKTCHHSQQKKSLFRHFFMFLMFLFSCLFTLNILNIRIFQQDCMLWTRLFNNAKIYIIFHIRVIFIHFFSQGKVKKPQQTPLYASVNSGISDPAG